MPSQETEVNRELQRRKALRKKREEQRRRQEEILASIGQVR